ncbi:type II secretion system F family protein [Verrucomicrobiota bacterium]
MSPIAHSAATHVASSKTHTHSLSQTKHKNRIPGSRKIVLEHLPGFSRKLAAMLTAGMPIVGCLKALQRQAHNPNFQLVIHQVREMIENGLSLSESLHHFPSIFDELFVNMVKCGEAGGQLPETIKRLALFLEARARLRHKIKSAMMYPIIVLSLALIIVMLMMIFIVPVFAEMFASFEAGLPGATQFLMDISNGIKTHGLYILLSLLITILFFQKWKATTQGAYLFDKLVLKTPVFGELCRNIASARFARTFGQLIHSGVPILNALIITSGATGNKVAERIVLCSRQAVEKGETLSSAMITQTVFPEMFVEMLQAGESTGKIDEMMDFVADFYEDEVNTMLNSLTALLEPLLIIFLGIIIGGIVICMFLPIFKMPTIINM